MQNYKAKYFLLLKKLDKKKAAFKLLSSELKSLSESCDFLLKEWKEAEKIVVLCENRISELESKLDKYLHPKSPSERRKIELLFYFADEQYILTRNKSEAVALAISQRKYWIGKAEAEIKNISKLVGKEKIKAIKKTKVFSDLYETYRKMQRS